jgi:hypothetical protein
LLEKKSSSVDADVPKAVTKKIASFAWGDEEGKASHKKF